MGNLSNSSLANPKSFDKRQLIVKTSSLANTGDGKLVEEKKWFVSVPDIDTVIGHSYYLFSSDLTYCVLVYLEKPNTLDSVIKSIVRISIVCLLDDPVSSEQSSRCGVELHRNVQCIRSTKEITSLKVSLSTAHVLCVLLNHENPKYKTVEVLKIRFGLEKRPTATVNSCSIDKNEIEVCPIKQIRLSPILTFIRDLSFNQFGDKLIVRCAKDFAVCPTSKRFRDKCEPFQGSNPFVTYNVSLKMEILVRDSHLHLGSCIEIYEIRVERLDIIDDNYEDDSPQPRMQLGYRLIWSVTAADLGLSRVHVFQVQSFTETLVFYNQMHTIHVLDPFKKKIIHQLELAGNDAALSSCTVNWSCQEVYVRFVDYSAGHRYTHTKVFPLRSPSLKSNTLLDLSAMQVLKTFSIKELSALKLPTVFHSKLGYF